MTEDNKFRITLGLFFIIVLASLTVYANVKKNEIEKLPSKNEPIRGIYGLILGDNINKISENKAISKVYSHIYSSNEYNYYAVKVKENSNIDLMIYTTKESGTIYKIEYKNDEGNACEMAESGFDELRKQYGIGNVNLMDALFNVKSINKDNKSIKLSCIETSLFSKRGYFYITYLDDQIEKNIDIEYEQYKTRRTKENLKLN